MRIVVNSICSNNNYQDGMMEKKNDNVDNNYWSNEVC